MSLLLVVLALGNSRVHVHTSYSDNVAFNIEAMVDESLGRCTTLEILYINLYNCYIRFWKDFDNMWL